MDQVFTITNSTFSIWQFEYWCCKCVFLYTCKLLFFK